MSTINVLLVGEAFMSYTERPPMRQSVTFHCRRKEKKGCLGPFNHDKKSYKAVKFRNVKAKKTTIKLHWEKRKKKTTINVIGYDTFRPLTKEKPKRT